MDGFCIDEVKVCGDIDTDIIRFSAVYNEKEIGYIVFIVRPNYEGDPAYVMPKDMNVLEEYRRKGVATKIIRTIPLKVVFYPNTGNTDEIHYSDDGLSFMEYCLESKIAQMQML